MLRGGVGNEEEGVAKRVGDTRGDPMLVGKLGVGVEGGGGRPDSRRGVEARATRGEGTSREGNSGAGATVDGDDISTGWGGLGKGAAAILIPKYLGSRVTMGKSEG